MDVRCTRCGIEYEFDDAKVTAAGVTVKCTACGHVFKVKREDSGYGPAGGSTTPPSWAPPGGTPPTVSQPPVSQTPVSQAPTRAGSQPGYSLPPGSLPPGYGAGNAFQPTFTGAWPPKPDGGDWMVRRTDGQVLRFKELTTLQKWIVESKVGRDDEISKTGRTWKNLGEIAELASFFQVVAVANAALSGAPAPAAAPGPEGSASSSRPTMAAGGSGPAPRAAPSPAGTDLAFDDLAEDDPVVRMVRRRRRNAALVVFALVLIAAAAAAYLFHQQLAVALGLEHLLHQETAATEAAKKAVRDDQLPEIKTARENLIAANSSLERAWLGRLEVALAAHLRAEAALHDALARLGVEPAEHAATAKKRGAEAEDALARAYALVARVRADAPSLVDGHLASAAYQLERGALAEMRSDLEAARAVAPHDASVSADIAILRALEEARASLDSDPMVGLKKLPAGDDGRLLSTRAMLAVLGARTLDEIDKARLAVGAIVAPDARLPLLLSLLDAKAKAVAAGGLPPASSNAADPSEPSAAEPSATEASATDASVDDGGAASGKEARTEASAKEAKEKGSRGKRDDGDYGQLMKNAERARVAGRSKSAHDLFERAAKLKPDAAAPALGLGWVSLDLGRNAEAVRSFRKAIELAPKLAEAHFGLAEALRFSGKKEQAVEAYRTYLQMDPNGRDAAVAKRAIDALGN